MMIKRIFLGVSQGLHYPSFTSLIGEKVRDGERSLLGVAIYTDFWQSVGSFLVEIFNGKNLDFAFFSESLTKKWLNKKDDPR